MESSNKLSRVAKRDKHQRFSIRKFNVGVASVAIAAFWMVSGNAVAADTLDVTPETAGDATALVESATEESADAEEEPASPEAEVAPEVIAEAPVVEEVAEVEEAPVAEEVVEAEAAEEDATEEAEVKSAEPSETKATASAAEKVAETPAAVQATRVAATTYRVRYVNEETGAIEFQRNYSVNEATENAADEPHTFNVSVNLEVPEGFVAVSANNAAGQDLAIVNNAIAAAVVEKDSSSRALFVTVRKDDVTANNNDKEGYTALRATEDSTSTGIIQEPAGATSSDYAISGAWEFSNQLPSEKDEVNRVSRQTDWNSIYGTATSVIPRENSTPVTVTVTVSDLENQTPENANRVQIQEASNNQASYGGESKHFTLMDDPSAVLALDIRVRPNRLTEDQNPNDKFNFDGEVESGYLTITFSEPVTDPIIDLSGVGGNVLGGGADAGQRFYRGSFNSTVWEYLGDEALELSEGAENLQINGNRIEVIDLNTTARVQEQLTLIQSNATGQAVGAIGTSAGTGSVKIVGTVTELKFKLHHQATPMSAFAHLETANAEFLLRNDGIGGSDGVNGLDRDMNDDGFNFTYSDNASGQLPNINADLQRFAIRLPTGWVTVDYVDTEGNPLGVDTYTDTNKGTSASVGVEYNTQEDTNERPDEIDYNGDTYYRVPAGDYEVGTVGENGELTETTTDLGTDPVEGEVELGQKRITYVYAKGGDVQVHYYQLDEDGNRTEIPLSGTAEGAAKDAVEATEEDTAKTAPGTPYNTQEDLRPNTITDADGKVWELVADQTDGYSEKGDEKDDTFPGEEGVVDSDTTKHINYYYKESKGDVKVNYFAVDADGNVIEFPEGAPLAASIEDTPMSSNGTPYNTAEDYKPATIKGPDGKVYELVEELTNRDGGDDEEGTVEAGKTKEVNYFYREVKTDVNVHYYAVDKDGNVITDEETGEPVKLQESAVDTSDASEGTEYNTAEDFKPDTIEKDGATYRRVDLPREDGTVNPHSYTDGDDETGTTEVIVNEDGTIDKTKDVNYYYERVTGDVNVHYFAVEADGTVIEFEDGEPLAPSVKDEDDQDIKVGYDTKDNRPNAIARDVKDETTDETETRTYKRVDLPREDGHINPHNYTDGAPEEGAVEEGEKDVNYYYQHIIGNVHARHYAVDKDGNVLELLDEVHDTLEGEIGETYDTTDGKTAEGEESKPETITKDGVTYKRVDLPREDGTVNPHPVTDGDAETGEVTEKDKVVNYYYERISGDVEVHYHIVDKDGNVLVNDAIEKRDVVTDENINQPYSTLEQKAPFITVGDKVYVLTAAPATDDSDPEEGAVEEGTKKVNYYYVEQPANVNVHYFAVDENGEVIGAIEGKTTGIAKEEVAADEADLDEAGNPNTNVAQGKGYDTTDLKPDTIETADGKVYQRVDLNKDKDGNQVNPHPATDGDAEEGQTEVTVNEDGTLDDTKDVNYYYEELKGDVKVNYFAVDADGKVIEFPEGAPLAESVEDTPLSSNGTEYDTTDEGMKPQYITGPDGKVYELVEELTDGDPESGDTAKVEAGKTKEVNYYYREVPANVNVHYHAVDENGEPLDVTLKDSKAVVEPGTAQGEEYDTTTEDLKPDTLEGSDGKLYQRVDLNKDADGNQVNPHEATDGDDEVGQTAVEVVKDEEGNPVLDEAGNPVLDDTKDVNYYYEEVKTNVNVHYYAVDENGEVLKDENGEPIKLQASAEDTKDAKQGTDYNTEDLKPEVILSGGKAYQRVDIAGTNPHPVTDGDAEDGQTEAILNEDGTIDNTKDVNYYYEEVPSNVLVNYYPVDKDGNVLTDAEGNPIVLKERVVDTYNVDQGTEYDTTDHRPTTITDENGDVWQLVSVKGTNPHAYTDGDDETGVTDAVIGEDGKLNDAKNINYYYEKLTANVNVHYFVIDDDGEVVELLDGETTGIEKATVEASEKDTEDAEQGTEYDTADLRPDTIKKDGVTYERVDRTDGDEPAGQATVTVDPVTGEVDDTKDVNYYYKRISGNVRVHYNIVDADGNVITTDAISPVYDEYDAEIAEQYTTEDKKLPYIVVDGKIYDLVTEENNPHATTDGDAETGEIEKGTKEVNYYYVERPANVNVHYQAVDKDGNVIDTELAPSKEVLKDADQGTDYDTTGEDTKPDTIVKDGVTYKRVDINGTNKHAATDGDDEIGKAEVTINEETGELDDTKDVNYYYERISGNVEVHYHIVDKDGNVLTEDAIEKADVKTDAEINETYDTTTEKKPYITVGDKVYVLTEAPESDESADEEGKVEEGTKKVNYYYVEQPTNVVVNYIAVDDEGNVLEIKIADPAEDTVKAAQGTDYNTAEDLKPSTIIDENGEVWQLVSVKGTNPHAETDGDAEEGKTSVTVNEDGTLDDTKEVNYYYEKVKANVNVHYHVVDENGEVVDTLGGVVSGIDKYTVEEIEKDTVEADQGTAYDTTDLRPDTIVKDGVTYKRVDINGTNPRGYTDGDDETGQATVTVDADGNVDDTKDVHYYYERISGDVEVHYHIVDKDGNLVKADAIESRQVVTDEDIAKPYSTESEKDPYIIVDGKIYDLVTEETSARPYTDGDDENGKVAEGTKKVNYYYVERPTSVNVHYYAVDKDGNVITDENGEPVKLQDSVEDTKDAAQGEDYDTTDNKPDTIVKDGVTYKRVDINGTNPHAATDGDDETGVTEATVGEDGQIDDTKDVNYYYERISGNVNVHYYAVDENGEVVEFADGKPLKGSVVDTEDENIDVDYTTTDNRPDFITRDTVDDTTGEPETRLYKRVDINGTNPHAYTDGDDEEGKVAEGDKDVNYYYEHIIGNVHVRYYAVDENGNVVVFEDGSKLADDVLDTVEGEIGEAYDTTEHKPDTIVKDGVTYKRVDLPREDGKVNPHAATDGDPETADVTEKDRVVNYYYEKVTGDVIVHYVDTEGNVIADEVVDTEKANIGEGYNTEDNKPATITFNDEVYYLTAKETEDVVDGKVVEGTTHVTYVYEKGGDVVVNYVAVDKDGNPLDIKIKEQARDTAEFTKPGTAYDTSDLKEQIIVDEDGNTWRLVLLAGTNPHAETDGADENGEVKAGETLEVNYYYELVTGDVVVSYVDEDGNQIAKNEVDTPKDTPTGKAYNTDEDLKPESITTADGTVYYLTEKETSDRSANPIGSVVEGTTYVEYVYAKAGSVVVNYYPVDAEGNQILDENGEPVVLQAQVEDTTNAKAGTEYDTTDLKPEEITDAEGRTWRLVSVAGTNPHAATDGDDETGAVASGETKAINYYYELVTGDVIVHYVDTEGNVIAEDAVDTEKGTATGTEYNTDEDLKPETITTADGTVYYLTAKETSEDSAPTTGEVVEGTTEITYVYEKAGHVEVHYHIVDEKGNVITTDAIDFVKDTENGKPGSEFDTTDHKPAEITVDGVTYVLVEELTDGDETGSVEAGATKVVNYHYVVKPAEDKPEEVAKGNVVVHYITEDGVTIADDVVDTADTAVGEAYDTTDNKPATITTADGKVYELVKVQDGDSETGEVVEGTTHVTYIYKLKEETPETPVAETGSVEVHYHIVDKDGNVITADAIDFVVDTEAGKSGDAYDTTDHKPSEITVNGVTYVLVADLTKDAETGSVEAGTTKKVNYYYVVKETTPVVPEEPVAPSKPVAVGEELSEEDKTKVIDSIDLPEGSTAEVTTPVQVDEQGQPHVEVEVTDNAGEKSTVKVPVEAVTVLAPAASTATPVTVGSELTEENAQIIIGRVTLPTGTTAEVTSPVKINNDGVAVVEVTVTDEAGNTTVVEVAVDAVVSPTEAVSPTTPVVVGDVLTPANAEAVIGSVKVPEGSTAEVTSPVQVDDNGNAYVEVTVTDAAGNTIVVKVPVEVATEPTTVWVTEDGKVLQARQDGNFAHADFDGYEFVRTEIDADGNITHIFRPAGGSFAAEPTTVWVTEDGKVLRPSEDGNFAHAEFDGYEFVRTEIDADGNITHIFRPAGGSFAAEQPTTIWITEDGKVLRPREDGSLDKSAFDGYEFVRTVVDADGHITHIFRPVAKTGETGTEGIGTTPRRSAQATSPKYVTKDTEQLPNTGEESNVATATGLGLLMSVLGLAGLRRRKED